MKTIRYFCNPGKTEISGIYRFLSRMNPRVNWQRDYPAKDAKKPHTPRPKRSNEDRAPDEQQRRPISGTTGERLRRDMLHILDKYPASFGADSCDAILLIDDADCEFENVEAWKKKTNELAEKIAQLLGREVPFYYLPESPEVEAWFLADSEHSFRKTGWRTTKILMVERCLAG